MPNADRDLKAFQEWLDQFPDELRGAILRKYDSALFRIYTRLYHASPKTTSELVRVTFLLGWYMRDQQGDFFARLEEELAEEGRDNGKEFAPSTHCPACPYHN